MGLHPGQPVEAYWNSTETGAIHPSVREAISLRRFEQIERCFHVPREPEIGAEPPEQDGIELPPILFQNVVPISDHLHRAFKGAWVPGRHLAIDESMERFTGRSVHKVTIPTKSTSEGYNIWVLADGAYVLDWLFRARDIGPIDLDSFWYLIKGVKGEDLTEAPKGFSKTQSVVLHLAANLGGFRN